jgi:hypothetical protein
MVSDIQGRIAIICLASVFLCVRAAAQEGYYGVGHERWHKDFYLKPDTIRAMHKAFREGGETAIRKVMKQQPAVFLKLLVLLVPRELGVTHSGGVKAMSDEQLETAVELLQGMVDQRLGEKAKIIEGAAETVALPTPDVVSEGSAVAHMAAPLPGEKARGLAGSWSLRTLPAPGKPPVTSHPCGFRTIQACPKDLSFLIWQVERAGEPPSNREGHAMDERTTDRTQSRISDTQAMALYSTLLFLVMLLWVYVPA